MLGCRYVGLLSVLKPSGKGLRNVKILVGIVNFFVFGIEVYYWLLNVVSVSLEHQ